MSPLWAIETPTLPTSPRASSRIGVVAGLGGQVEGDREAGLSLGEVLAVELVGAAGVRVARVGAHHPGPVALRQAVLAHAPNGKSPVNQTAREPLDRRRWVFLQSRADAPHGYSSRPACRSRSSTVLIVVRARPSGWRAASRSAPIPVANYSVPELGDVQGIPEGHSARAASANAPGNQGLGVGVGKKPCSCVYRTLGGGRLERRQVRPRDGRRRRTVTGGSEERRKEVLRGGRRARPSEASRLRAAGPPRLDTSGSSSATRRAGGAEADPGRCPASSSRSEASRNVIAIRCLLLRRIEQQRDRLGQRADAWCPASTPPPISPTAARRCVTGGVKGSRRRGVGVRGAFDNVTVQVPNPPVGSTDRPSVAGRILGGSSTRVATTTVERPKSAGPEEGLGGNWLVIVLNDDHNTFDHVAKTLARA